VTDLTSENPPDLLAQALLAALLSDSDCLRRLAQAVSDVDASAAHARPPAYTVEGLAETIAVSPRAVRNAITRGELQAVKRGGRWLIAQDAVDAWTHARRLPGPTRLPHGHGKPARRRNPLHEALARLEQA